MKIRTTILNLTAVLILVAGCSFESETAETPDPRATIILQIPTDLFDLKSSSLNNPSGSRALIYSKVDKAALTLKKDGNTVTSFNFTQTEGFPSSISITPGTGYTLEAEIYKYYTDKANPVSKGVSETFEAVKGETKKVLISCFPVKYQELTLGTPSSTVDLIPWMVEYTDGNNDLKPSQEAWFKFTSGVHSYLVITVTPADPLRAGFYMNLFDSSGKSIRTMGDTVEIQLSAGKPLQYMIPCQPNSVYYLGGRSLTYTNNGEPTIIGGPCTVTVESFSPPTPSVQLNFQNGTLNTETKEWTLDIPDTSSSYVCRLTLTSTSGKPVNLLLGNTYTYGNAIIGYSPTESQASSGNTSYPLTVETGGTDAYCYFLLTGSPKPTRAKMKITYAEDKLSLPLEITVNLQYTTTTTTTIP